MSSDKEENNLKLTTSDILNALQHGATREDIAEIRQEMAQQRSDFNSRIDKLDDKMDIVSKDLSSRIDSNFKWTVGIILVGILVPIVLHFIH